MASNAFPEAVGRPDPVAGVFETVRIDGGVPLALGAHMQRLAGACARLYGIALAAGDARARVRDALAVLGRDGAWNGRLRVSVRPGGPAGVLGFRPEVLPRPGVATPCTLRPLVIPGGWGEHKWRDRSPFAGTDAARGLLLLDDTGDVLETEVGNVFVVRGDGAVTAPLDGRVLPGITRGLLIGLLAAAGASVEERPIRVEDLAAADEVFLTNSVRGVQGVTACDGVGEWDRGRFTLRAGALLGAAWEGERAGART